MDEIHLRAPIRWFASFVLLLVGLVVPPLMITLIVLKGFSMDTPMPNYILALGVTWISAMVGYYSFLIWHFVPSIRSMALSIVLMPESNRLIAQGRVHEILQIRTFSNTQYPSIRFRTNNREFVVTCAWSNFDKAHDFYINPNRKIEDSLLKNNGETG